MSAAPSNLDAPAASSEAPSRVADGKRAHLRRQQAATRLILLAGAALIGLPLVAGAGAPAVSATGAAGPTEGELLFRRTCAACHGPNARGLPGLGKDLVRSAFARRLTDAQLIAFITRGRPANDPANTTGIPMPPKGGNPALTRRDIADIVAYIRTLQRR